MPSARRTFVRVLPSCAVLVFGAPIAALALPSDAAQDDRTPWALLVYLCVIVLTVIVHYLTRAPRPRQDPEVDTAQRRRALVAAAETGAVPTDPAVRRTTGVFACERIEIFAVMVSAVVGVLAGSLARPELDWWFIWGPVLVGALASGFRLRSGLSYLRALHPAKGVKRIHRSEAPNR
ncbi:hypothetical protein [Citricoccus zhacaiensis]|uniref:hypothetical protein n=1 Tax=Citricoccus zhacaiensis TaxID=489142 RepID=UPI00166F4677|nr:hypothetical protein [Citricoccus zhacaiensis]